MFFTQSSHLLKLFQRLIRLCHLNEQELDQRRWMLHCRYHLHFTESVFYPAQLLAALPAGRGTTFNFHSIKWFYDFSCRLSSFFTFWKIFSIQPTLEFLYFCPWWYRRRSFDFAFYSWQYWRLILPLLLVHGDITAFCVAFHSAFINKTSCYSQQSRQEGGTRVTWWYEMVVAQLSFLGTVVRAEHTLEDYAFAQLFCENIGEPVCARHADAFWTTRTVIAYVRFIFHVSSFFDFALFIATSGGIDLFIATASRNLLVHCPDTRNPSSTFSNRTDLITYIANELTTHKIFDVNKSRCRQTSWETANSGRRISIERCCLLVGNGGPLKRSDIPPWRGLIWWYCL